MPEAEIVEKIDPRFRGHITNRLLSKRLPPLKDELYLKRLAEYGATDDLTMGELDYLGMKPSDLIGKILDVGVGGGRALLQAVKNGYDYYGVDVALKATIGGLHPGVRSQMRESVARESLRRVVAQYPDRLIEADATVKIPFSDNYFDTVIACVSLPMYARNRDEVIKSILEMIRVSKSKVAFVSGYNEVPKEGEKRRYGVGLEKDRFDFCLVDFLNDLERYGIKVTWVVVDNEVASDIKKIVSAHLDVTNKDQERLKIFVPDLERGY